MCYRSRRCWWSLSYPTGMISRSRCLHYCSLLRPRTKISLLPFHPSSTTSPNVQSSNNIRSMSCHRYNRYQQDIRFFAVLSTDQKHLDSSATSPSPQTRKLRRRHRRPRSRPTPRRELQSAKRTAWRDAVQKSIYIYIYI